MRFPHLMVSALTASGLILSGCSAVDCSDLDLESDFEAGSPCFEDYERPTELDIEQLSTADASISHNNGQNCMSCHQANGPGMGQFTAAGTVHKVDGSRQSSQNSRSTSSETCTPPRTWVWASRSGS